MYILHLLEILKCTIVDKIYLYQTKIVLKKLWIVSIFNKFSARKKCDKGVTICENIFRSKEDKLLG